MSAPDRQRIFWLDAAKAYGMFLVYYGHIVERFYNGDNQAALLQDRLIYAFHMPLFFFISGFFARQTPDTAGTFVRKGLLTRILPVLFFSVLMIPGMAVEHAQPPNPDWYSAEFKTRWFDDWPELCQKLSSTAEDAQARARGELWQSFSPEVQAAIQAGAKADSLAESEKTFILDGLNASMARPLYDLDDADYIYHSKFVQFMLKNGAEALSDEDRGKVHVTLTFAILYPDWRDETFWQELWEDISRFYPTGFPLNLPTWFLVGLLVVELYHFLVGRFLQSTPRLFVAIPVLLATGVYINHGAGLESDIFFAREGIVLYAFYLLGNLLHRTQLLDRLSPLASGALFTISAAVLLGTFNLNPGSSHYNPVVLINLSQHGHPYYFAIAALAGCFTIAGLSLLTPNARWISWVGSNTLLLMGTNGFFFGFLNWRLRNWITIADSQVEVLGWVTLFTFLQMAASVPLVLLLKHYLPQLVGRPRDEGPLLPKLM